MSPCQDKRQTCVRYENHPQLSIKKAIKIVKNLVSGLTLIDNLTDPWPE